MGPAHHAAKRPAWRQRKRWVLEPGCLYPSSAVSDFVTSGKLLNFFELCFLLCKKGSIIALPLGTVVRTEGANRPAPHMH